MDDLLTRLFAGEGWIRGKAPDSGEAAPKSPEGGAWLRCEGADKEGPRTYSRFFPSGPQGRVTVHLPPAEPGVRYTVRNQGAGEVIVRTQPSHTARGAPLGPAKLTLQGGQAAWRSDGQTSWRCYTAQPGELATPKRPGEVVLRVPAPSQRTIPKKLPRNYDALAALGASHGIKVNSAAAIRRRLRERRLCQEAVRENHNRGVWTLVAGAPGEIPHYEAASARAPDPWAMGTDWSLI